MTFTLPDLPYAKDALEPHISARTLDFHHGKHHNAYVVNLNNFVKDTPLAALSLEEIITQTAKNPDQGAIFNNAAQVWNHTFFWHCMKPQGGGMPSKGFLEKLTKAFGTFEDFKAQFKQAAVSQFGSGWAWLVHHEGNLKIVKTSNAGVPFTDGMIPLLTCDVWEHAYYLDYQNRRPDYVDTFMTHLINWDFVEHNYPKG